MQWGTLLLQAILGGAALAMLAAFTQWNGAHETRERILRVALAAIAAALTVGLVLLVTKFLLVDTSTFYVWRYTHAEHPWYYRLSGVWGGQAGTLFLWAWYAGAFALLIERATRSDAGAWNVPRRARGVAIGSLAFLVLVLTALSLQQGLFLPSSGFRLLESGMSGMTPGMTPGMTMSDWVYAPGIPGIPPNAVAPEGNGLNPLLLTPFMVVHPWIEFAAYALSGVVFALVLSYVLTGHTPMRERAFLWARAAWIVYTLAIALGALWAYYTLSFGGYWAWDPVETVNLLPWIALTAYLHLAPQHKRHGRFDSAAPMLGMSAFVLTLLSTYLTRSGVWNGSVHAFITDGALEVDDAGARLLSILAAEPGVDHLTRLLVGVTFVASLALLYRAHTAARADLAIRVYLAIHAALLVALLASPERLLAASIELARRITPADYAIAWSILWTLVLAVPHAHLYLRRDDATEFKLDHRRFVAASAGVLTLALVVFLILLLRSVNGTQRQPFDQRAPIVATVLIAILTTYFASRIATMRLAFLLVALTGSAGLVLAIALPDRKMLWLAAPTLLAGILVTLAATAKSIAPHADLRVRMASAAYLAGGIFGLFMWTSPPRTLDLVVTTLPVTPIVVVFGLAASVSSLLAAHLAASEPRSTRALVLGALAILSHGRWIATALALVGAALSLTRPARAPGPRASAQALHRASLPLLHCAILVTMLGYGLSTYTAQDYDFTQESPLELGVPERLGEYTVTFERSEGQDADANGVYENVDTYLTLERDGLLVTQAVLSMYFVPSREHYDPSTVVERGALEDVYFNSNFRSAHAMYSEADGWVVGHGPTTEVHSADITKLALHIRVLPYVSLLWAGILLGTIAMTTRLATRPFLSPSGAPARDQDAGPVPETAGK